MAKRAGQKGKLLALLEIFRQRTDEEHMLTLKELQAALLEYGISTERKSLYDDMETLRRFGYDVIAVKQETTRYYLGARLFELAELKLLVDAVEGSRFITRKKSDELIRKLSADCSRYDARGLARQVHVAGRVKTMNESIYYNVDLIHAAISADRRIHFRYYEWNAKKERVLRHGGAYYEVSPWALTWDDENYYLIAYDHAAGAIRHYRVDKMQGLSVTDLSREGEKVAARLDLASYSKGVFGMFGGKSEGVVLRCANHLAGVIIDRFGTDLPITADGEGFFRIHVSVAVSPVFLSWVLGFGQDMRVLSPAHVIEELVTLAKQSISQYE